MSVVLNEASIVGPATSPRRQIYVGLPAYNEEVALPRLLARITRLASSSIDDVTVVLYNDGSTDETLSIAKQWQAKALQTKAWQTRLPVIVLDGVRNQGLGAGLRALVEYAVAHGSDDDVLVVMDCDDTHDPSQIPDMIGAISGGADVVVASRFTRGSLVRGVPLMRRVTGLGAMVLFKLVHPVRGVADYTCGYRGYRIGVLKMAADCYGPSLVQESGFACMVELLLKLQSFSLRMAQVPLQLRYDQKPTASKMGVSSNIRRLLRLLVQWRISGVGVQP